MQMKIPGPDQKHATSTPKYKEKDAGKKLNRSKSSKRFQSHIDLKSEGFIVSTPFSVGARPSIRGCLFSPVGLQRSPPLPWALHWHPECSEQTFASTQRHRSSVALEGAWAAQPEAEHPEAEPPMAEPSAP